MNVFIDESGSFANVLGKNGNGNFNCVAAVIMNDNALDQWTEKYADLSKAREIRDPVKMNEIMNYLAVIGAKAFFVFTDISPYCNSIKEHKSEYIDSIRTTINSYSTISPDIALLPDKIYGLSGEEYIKACLFIRILSNIIRGIFVSEFEQNDTQKILWRSDDLNSPKLREVIKKLLLLDLTERTRHDPINVNNQNKVRNWLNPDDSSFDLAHVYRDFKFEDENNCIGIKAADCVANFLRRSLNGTEFFEDTKSLEKIFDLEESVDAIHFNKNMPFLDTSVVPENIVTVFIFSKVSHGF